MPCSSSNPCFCFLSSRLRTEHDVAQAGLKPMCDHHQAGFFFFYLKLKLGVMWGMLRQSHTAEAGAEHTM